MQGHEVGDDGVDEKFFVPFMFKLVFGGVASSPGVWRATACAKNFMVGSMLSSSGCLNSEGEQ